MILQIFTFLNLTWLSDFWHQGLKMFIPNFQTNLCGRVKVQSLYQKLNFLTLFFQEDSKNYQFEYPWNYYLLSPFRWIIQFIKAHSKWKVHSTNFMIPQGKNILLYIGFLHPFTNCEVFPFLILSHVSRKPNKEN